MEHRRQASPDEIEWLGPGTRGDTCRVRDGDRAVIVRADEQTVTSPTPSLPLGATKET